MTNYDMDELRRIEQEKFPLGETWFLEFLNRKLLQTHKNSQIVKDFIEDAKKEIKEEKERMKEGIGEWATTYILQ